MSTQQNKALVSSIYESFGRGDLDAVYGTLADDVVFVNHSPENSPLRGEYKGIDGAQDFFGRLLEATQPLRLEVEDLIADGDKVVAIMEGTYQGQQNGHREDTRLAHAFTIAEEKVTRFEDWPGVTSALFA